MSIPLTPAQSRIAALLARGMTNKAIAADLGLAANTVKKQLELMYVRLGVANRTEAAVRLANLKQE
jgi:two-component system nitrate/nitrite response regulator NarP